MRLLQPALNAACLTAALLLLSLPLAIQPAQAAETAKADKSPGIAIELNTARQTGANCNLSFVFRNSLPSAIEAMILEVVLFNTEGLVDKFLRLKTGALPPGKMRVKQFVLKGRSCTGLSRILINDVPVCRGGNLPAAACLGAVRVNSRSHIELTL